MTTRARPAAPKPETQATQAARNRQQAEGMRLGAAAAIFLLLIIPHIPSPLVGLDWWAALAPSMELLFLPLLPAMSIDLPLLGTLTIPAFAPILLGQWVLAAFLSFLALTMLMHLGSLYAQRMRPLRASRTYVRVTVPVSVAGKSTDALAILRSLHGMLPPLNPMQPTAPPLILCWTARPERPIQAGVSVCGDAGLLLSMQKRFLGIRSGTKAVEVPDPFWAELNPGRVLCVAEVRTVAGNTLPIAVLGREQSLLAALLPTMAPQAGVLTSSIRIIQEPIPDRAWRLDVLALLERMQRDASLDEQAALKAKAAGPAYRTGIQLLAIADDVSSGTVQIQTMAAALAGTAQSVASSTQRLQAGPVVVFPAMILPPAPFPRPQRWIGFGIGMGLLISGIVLLVLTRHATDRPLWWAIPPLVGVLPILALALRHRRSQQANMWEHAAAIRVGLLPPLNPQVVPLWWPWLGRDR